MQKPNPQENQQITDTLQELKQEIKNLRNQLNKLESQILKEKIKSIENALTQNRLLLYADQLQDELDEDIQKIPDTKCKNHDQCLDRFKTMATENLQIIRNLKIEEAMTDLDTKIGKMEQVIQKSKGSPCEACHRDFQKKLRREKRAFQTITLVEKTTEKTDAELNIDRLVEGVLEPLANSARLKILISTFEGKKSFSKIAQITGLKGGHLLFHIKKLVDAGLVAQEDNKGDYVVTQRGVDVAQKIVFLQS
ncbi:MAG: ArsR family transcriptional regulator [Candidatus Bathyarchaeia archaeon]|jgi:DNA-binding transcriptional ArsR family regulator